MRWQAATRALGRVGAAAQGSRRARRRGPGGRDADPLLRAESTPSANSSTCSAAEHGWWDRYDPADFGRYADAEQWELVDTYITEASSIPRPRPAPPECGASEDGRLTPTFEDSVPGRG